MKRKLHLNSSINILRTNKMKTKKLELDVDFIGGQGSLTFAEEKALSDFFSQGKLTTKKSLLKKQLRKTKQPKETVRRV